MRVLVTGGAGFIGSHIVDRLFDCGDEVLVVDNLSTGSRENLPSETRLEELDVSDPKLLKFASSFQPELVTHCAAQASVTVSIANPRLDAQSNIIGGINVSQATIESGCAQLIYVNTGGALYGEPEYVPCDEEHPIRPISPYALSKATLESYLRLLLPGSVQLKVLRLANVYGPRQVLEGEAGVVSIFGPRMLRGEPVTIFGDGEQTRDYVYVKDAAQAHELARNTSSSFTVNVSSGKATSVNELFGLMAAETGYDLSPVYAARRPGEIEHSVLDNSRAKSLLGWYPETTLEEGLRETVDWLRAKL